MALLQIAQNVDIIFISVKPQYVGTVIKEMKPHLTGKHIMVSIAAGIPLSVMKVSGLCALLCMHSCCIASSCASVSHKRLDA